MSRRLVVAWLRQPWRLGNRRGVPLRVVRRWNHHGTFTNSAYQILNSGEDFVGEPLAPLPEHIHDFFDGWVNRASFSRDKDGYPL
jgi:hypothetical protein